MVLSMSSRDRFNALLEQWILPEYRMPLLCVYSINAFLFVAKIVLGNIIGG
ncbi:hypothetical protein BMR1_02g02712 [Babesia microti strain RI]|uniref:Uncharacterized protein n=1 Tax=Babesia microti (strain RI) TaxID=1133968 RepID=A0A1R4AAP6_BABMR|nr:hypothetical protein BMR1_02g02712 [Babesia microti strain RI]SJK86034.1 hypothetical protein BMR1_02g02712 [Babesia microti strain RI]|eukprot:XP_021338231.1 hypothetical protein BMR1_02g02712 [Babesia microti strain RI]